LRFYYFALTAFILVVTFIWLLMRSQYGRAFRSIAENVRLPVPSFQQSLSTIGNLSLLNRLDQW